MGNVKIKDSDLNKSVNGEEHSKNESIPLELAYKLSLNSLNTSLWNVLNSNKNVYKTILKNPPSNFNKNIKHFEKTPERLIVLLGAGASHDTLS